MHVLNERIEEEIEEDAGHGPSSPETNSMAGRVRVCNEGPHFLIEVRRGRGESRKTNFRRRPRSRNANQQNVKRWFSL